MSQSFYFEPPSRIQLVDKMAHLLRYSDFLVVISGPEGSGKSSVAQRLALVTHSSDICQIVVTLESEAGALSLARQCAKLVSDDYVDDMDPLTILHEKNRVLHEIGQHLLILVDNAEWLNDEAIELLAGLLVSGVGKPKIVLSGDDALVNRLNSLSLYELLEGRLHLESLQPFTEDEAKEFLALKFSSQQDLNKREFKNVYDASSGYPGRLTSAASELYRSGKVVSRVSKLPLPIAHMAGISIVLLGVLFISIWQVLQENNESLEPQIVDGRVSVPLSVTLDNTQAVDTQADAINEVQGELSKLLADQERLLKQQKDLAVVEPVGIVEPVAKEEEVVLEQGFGKNKRLLEDPVVEKVAEIVDDIKPAVVVPLVVVQPAVVSKQPIVKPIVNPIVKPKAAVAVETVAFVKATTPIESITKPKVEVSAKVDRSVKVATTTSSVAHKWLKEDQLLSWPSSGYTLQVLGARSEESIIQFMKSLDSQNRLYYFTTIYKNAPWHVLVYGQYANRTAANRAINSLPQELKKLQPWARSISGVQSDIKKK